MAYFAKEIELYRGISRPGRKFVGMCLTEDERVAGHYARARAGSPQVARYTLALKGLRVKEVEGYDRGCDVAPGDHGEDMGGADVIVFRDESPEGRAHETWRIVSEKGLAALTPEGAPKGLSAGRSAARRAQAAPAIPADADASFLGYPAKPTAFIATAGESRHAVEIWELQPTKDAKAHTVGAYEREKNRFVGVVELRVATASEIYSGRCSSDIEGLAERFGVSNEKLLRVEGAYVAPPFRGEGVGVALYIAAAAVARKLGMALAADSCFDSTTSGDAARVWKSREFKEFVEVGASGRVAVFKQSRRAK